MSVKWQPQLIREVDGLQLVIEKERDLCEGASLTGISSSGWSGKKKGRVNTDKGMEHKQNWKDKHNSNVSTASTLSVSTTRSWQEQTAGAKMFMTEREEKSKTKEYPDAAESVASW